MTTKTDEHLFHIDNLSRLQYRHSPRNIEVRKTLYTKFSSPRCNLYEKIIQAMKLGGHETVIDIGCGAGKEILEIVKSSHFGKIIGVNDTEIYTETQNTLEEKGVENVKFVKMDARSLAFPTNSADVVVALYILYHIADPEKALDEMKRVLKGGVDY